MHKKGIYYTIASAILFGITPLLTKCIYQYGADSITVVFYRSILVALILALLLIQQRISFHINRSALRSIVTLAFCGSGLTTLLLFTSYSYIDTGSATNLHFLYPVFVAVMVRFIYHEKLQTAKRLALCIALLGMCCFFMDMEGGSIWGFLLAIFSSITYAFYMVYLEKSHLTHMHPYLLSFYLGICIALETLLYHLFKPSIQWVLPLPAYGWLALLALCSSFLAVVWLQKGIRYLGSTTASLFCLFEPVTSLIVGIFFLQEAISVPKILGSALILLALLCFVCFDRRRTQISDETTE